MNKTEFISAVQRVVTPDDFQKNNHILSNITENHYEHYINCLLYGFTMYSAKKALAYIYEISLGTHLSSADVLGLLPKFSAIIAIMNDRNI